MINGAVIQEELPAPAAIADESPDVTISICLHRGRSLLSKLIQWQTRGPYSHASLLLPSGKHFEAREGKGTLLHPRFTAPRGDVVDVFDLTITAEQAEALEHWIAGEVGAPYDWRAIFAFLSRTTPKDASADKWFCSEAIVAALAAIGITLFRATEPWEVCPVLLSRALRLGLQPTRTLTV